MHENVIGPGTILNTSRFRSLLGQQSLQVDNIVGDQPRGGFGARFQKLFMMTPVNRLRIIISGEESATESQAASLVGGRSSAAERGAREAFRQEGGGRPLRAEVLLSSPPTMQR